MVTMAHPQRTPPPERACVTTAEQAVTPGAIAATDVLKWCQALSGHADGLGEKVMEFFNNVRAQS